jgi:type VI secretion system secreted protein VgrG
VSSPLGEDALLLAAFTGREELSRLFEFQLEFFSENDAIAPGDVVGQPITWAVRNFEDEPRFFHGYVNRFVAGSKTLQGLRAYRADVVPWLWFLSQTADFRTFQNKTAAEIIKAVFDDLRFSDYELALTRTLRRREYCVQYRETAFDFVSRLMEEEGIFYFFKHADGKHTLVLADSHMAYADCKEGAVEFGGGSLTTNQISAWEHQYEFRPGRWTQTDYNFETPSRSLFTATNTLVQLPGIERYEMFDYPGLYSNKMAEGQPLTKIRMEAEETPHDVVTGAGTCCTFTPGGKFRLARHECQAEEQTYVLTRVQHSGADPTYLMNGDVTGYNNTFTCIPAAVQFRPARLTPKPVVQGPQTAVVVGPQGQEIYTDKYGRIKVQFFWDRQGKRDENSSVWMRVAQVSAGNRWGAAFWPRVGQEVVVDFLEGDPDRPLITGSVYNAEQMPPYELPDNQTQSGIKTRSSKEGNENNFNELRFEDRKGHEEIVLHAERNLSQSVEHDETIQVFHNRTLTVGGGKDNSDPTKDGTLTETIEGNVYFGVQKGDYTHEVQKGQTSIKAKTQIKLEVGSSSLLMKADGTIELKGVKITIEGSTIDSVAGGVHTIKGTPVKLNC